MERLVYGVGINDADYLVTIEDIVDGKRKVIWRCPFYSRWMNMFERCYSLKFHIRRPTYSDCSVAKDWHKFSSFKRWMEKQDWEGKQLDKDLLFPGNKIYGPDTCIFIDNSVNNFLLERGAARGDLPLGVHFNKKKNKFQATCSSVLGKRKNLGYFETAKEAHKAWLDFKFEQAKILASLQVDQRVAKALLTRYEIQKL